MDLAEVGLRIALGAELPELVLCRRVFRSVRRRDGTLAIARGIAVQARVNTETLSADGGCSGRRGTLTWILPPTGPGIRVDTFGWPGLESVPVRFAAGQVIVHTRAADFGVCRRKAATALNGFAISGVDTNIAVLLSISVRRRVQLMRRICRTANRTYGTGGGRGPVVDAAAGTCSMRTPDRSGRRPRRPGRRCHR